MNIPSSETQFIHQAADYLESTPLTKQLANLVHLPGKSLIESVVPSWMVDVFAKSLSQILSVATKTIGEEANQTEKTLEQQVNGNSAFWHRVAVTLSGGMGGFFGLPGLAIELPLTNLVIFRSIASIAQGFGEDICTLETRLECMTVFSHGSPSPHDDGNDSSYLRSRVLMTAHIVECSTYFAQKVPMTIANPITDFTAPQLVQFIAKILSRFNIIVSQKVIAQSVPLVGAACGALINNLFLGHFNEVATYHFGLRNLEKKYGRELIHSEYQNTRAIRAKGKNFYSFG